MNIRILRYFLAVAREENITKAAKSLHISQPSLSIQLKELEDELGKKLIFRGKRKIHLTDEGIILRKRSEEILDLIEKTKQEITASNNKITGNISIGSGESNAMNVAIQTASVLNKSYPDIHYHLFSGDAEDITERLDSGLLDFGILIEPIDISKYNHIHLPITDIWGLLMKSDSPLSEKDFILPDDLQEFPIIAPKRTGLHDEFSDWLKKDFKNLNIIATYNLANNASLLVNGGMGYALVLDKLVYTGKNSNLKFCPFYPPIEANMSIVWKKHIIQSKPAQLFIDELEKTIVSLHICTRTDD